MRTRRIVEWEPALIRFCDSDEAHRDFPIHLFFSSLFFLADIPSRVPLTSRQGSARVGVTFRQGDDELTGVTFRHVTDRGDRRLYSFSSPCRNLISDSRSSRLIPVRGGRLSTWSPISRSFREAPPWTTCHRRIPRPTRRIRRFAHRPSASRRTGRGPST